MLGVIFRMVVGVILLLICLGGISICTVIGASKLEDMNNGHK